MRGVCDTKKKKKNTKANLDELERLECEDWAEDKRRREWKKSEDYQKREKLAEKFKEKKKG